MSYSIKKSKNCTVCTGKEDIAYVLLTNHQYGSNRSKNKELRLASGFSIVRLADILGVSQQTICKWQKGQVIPSIDHCVELSEIFRVPINDFIVTDAPVRALDRFVREDERSSFFALKQGILNFEFSRWMWEV